MDTTQENTTRGRVARQLVRPIALAFVFTMPGFLLRLLFSVALDLDISRLAASVLNFGLAAIGALIIFPRALKQPFGHAPLGRAVSLAEHTRRLGLYLPTNAWRHIALGVVLALCTLGGMLAASLTTGRYVIDWANVPFDHVIFSLNPGVWEEVFFRGIIMLALLRYGVDLKRAALIQIVLFGLTHVKGFALLNWVDVLSVTIIGTALTYIAYKTRTLVAPIVLHTIHDTFLFFVQAPKSDTAGAWENVVFFAVLWLMVGVACLLTRFAADRLGVRAEAPLYEAAEVDGSGA